MAGSVKVCIDPGHGGRDPGAAANGLQEKDIVLRLAKDVDRYLRTAGIETIMTRESDKYVFLADRVKLANMEKVNLFLSIHVNAGGGTGFESYRFPGSVKGAEYQEKIHDAVMQYLGPLEVAAGMFEAEPIPKEDEEALKFSGILPELPDRGRKAERFYVLKYTAMPAVLLECLFIDNSRDVTFLKDKDFLAGLARAIADGVMAALGVKNENSEINQLRRQVQALQNKINRLQQENERCRQTLQHVAILTSEWMVKN